jgi:hypothetical protein
MSDSGDERMARLEVLVAELRDDIKENRVSQQLMSTQIAELNKAAHMGRGALWLLLPTGTFIGWMLSHIWPAIK